MRCTTVLDVKCLLQLGGFCKVSSAKQGGSQCKTGFSDLQNVAMNRSVIQRTATKFGGKKLILGAVLLSI
jgi:hypothetical protein